MRLVHIKAEADIWMQEINGLYECIAVYIDDLLIASRNPKEIVQTLQEMHGFKLKGVGPLTYHLVWDYFCDKSDRTLCYGPKTYIAKMFDQYKKMFGSQPREYASPLDKGDHHPKVDTIRQRGGNKEVSNNEWLPAMGYITWPV